jgi:hypothetical protein
MLIRGNEVVIVADSGGRAVLGVGFGPLDFEFELC